MRMDKGISENKSRLGRVSVLIDSAVDVKNKRRLLYITALLADGTPLRSDNEPFFTRARAIKEIHEALRLYPEVLWIRADNEHTARIVRRATDLPPNYRVPPPVYMIDRFGYW